MTHNTKWLAPYAIIITCFYCYPAAGESSEAAAEDTNAQGSLAEIIVTAQKRSERVNNVPMTVTALQGDQLVSLGVKDPSDLVKVVPGLVYTKSAWGAPVYTLRGIGYYDTSLSAVPAVTIYTDQVPLPYSALTTFTTLDVQRVEVLKGPQGTLYGESSTGGAINYVANRPSDTFGAGMDFSFGRFNDATTDAFITGPLTDTLKARLAIHNEESGDWQYSLTRPGDTHGKKNITMGRLLLDWSPTAKLSAQLNINFGLNRSDTQAPQFQTINPQNAFALFVASTFHPRFLTYPKATNPRSADWDANSPFGMDSKQHQAALTVEYAASDALTLTSISSYVNYRPSSRLDADGTDLLDLKMNVFGEITTYFQELRAHGTVSDKFNWIVGLNYSNDHILQHVQADIRDSFLGSAVVGFGLNTGNGDFRKKTKSAYVSADYEIAPRLKISAGTRVSSTDFENQNCTTADSALTAATASAIQGTPIGIGDCFTLTPLGVPGVTTFRDHESNAPWRFVVESKINPETLLYASASKGFKSGTYPNIAATTYQTNRFVKQENLLDYEAGFKATLFNRLMQVNGAAFYYDYKNKQVLGSQIDPKLGVALNTSVNIPTSRVIGSELEVTVAPITGLTLGIAGTYLDTRITGSFVNVDFLGLTRQLAGGPLPYAPRISLVARADYKHPISDKWDAYIGGLLNYKSSSNAGLGEQSLAKIDGYSTIDAQMGVESNNLRIGLWGRNITDKLYYNSAFTPLGDSIARYAGMPAEFGILFSYRY